MKNIILSINNTQFLIIYSEHYFSHHFTMSYQLNVRVVEAKNLPNTDTIGLTDPYVLLQFPGGQIYSTKVIDDNLNPKWNELFMMPILDMNATLTILVRDKDISKDDNVCKQQIHLSSLVVDDIVDRWFPLLSMNGKEQAGEIHLVLHIGKYGNQPFVTESGKKEDKYADEGKKDKEGKDEKKDKDKKDKKDKDKKDDKKDKDKKDKKDKDKKDKDKKDKKDKDKKDKKDKKK